MLKCQQEMIRARLIFGGTATERLEFAQQIIKETLGSLKHPDLLIIKAFPSVTINQIREVEKRLSLKPYSGSSKIILIPQAEKITLPAQNALLKTLEEPPGETLIILLASQKESLLPTIISRCQLISLATKPQIEIEDKLFVSHFSLLVSISKSRVGEKFKLAEKIAKNREEAIKFCQAQLLVWREILLYKTQVLRATKEKLFQTTASQISKTEAIKTIRHLQQTLTMLETNINPRLALENLLVSYPSPTNENA